MLRASTLARMRGLRSAAIAKRQREAQAVVWSSVDWLLVTDRLPLAVP